MEINIYMYIHISLSVHLVFGFSDRRKEGKSNLIDSNNYMVHHDHDEIFKYPCEIINLGL